MREENQIGLTVMKSECTESSVDWAGLEQCWGRCRCLVTEGEGRWWTAKGSGKTGLTVLKTECMET